MIAVERLTLTYRGAGGVHPALRGVSLSVARGEFLALLGPSGCGKTTLLRCIAGLEEPDGGRISIGERPVFDAAAGVVLPAAKRDLGMVFQSYAIWPHMSVFENAAFPLRYRCPGMRGAARAARVRAVLDMVQLAHLADRPAPMLSGGQQQRLALARALVSQPAVLLLDEPLSNLDARLREEMRFELRRITKSLNVTTVFVTHEQAEALSMADEVAVMRDGEVLQADAPWALYDAPRSAFVADFVGRANLIPGVLRDGAVETALGMLACVGGGDDGERVTAVVRPEGLRLDGTGVAAEIVSAAFLGDATEYEVRVGELLLRVRGDARRRFEPGRQVRVSAEGPVTVLQG